MQGQDDVWHSFGLPPLTPPENICQELCKCIFAVCNCACLQTDFCCFFVTEGYLVYFHIKMNWENIKKMQSSFFGLRKWKPSEEDAEITTDTVLLMGNNLVLHYFHWHAFVFEIWNGNNSLSSAKNSLSSQSLIHVCAEKLFAYFCFSTIIEHCYLKQDRFIFHIPNMTSSQRPFISFWQELGFLWKLLNSNTGTI